MVFGRTVQSVVDDLDRLGPHGAGLGRLVRVVVLADRDPQVADAARLHLFGQRGPQLRVVEGLAAAGVELVEVDVIGSQRLERGVELPEDLVRLPQLIPLEGAQVAVTELGGDEPLLAVTLDAWSANRLLLVRARRALSCGAFD